MIRKTMQNYEESSLSIETVIISELLDEFLMLYCNKELSSLEQIEYLGFINTLFRLKHKFILDYNKEKRTVSRNTQILHLKKIQRFAKARLKALTPPSPRRSYKATEEVYEFKKLLLTLNKKMKQEISSRTKKLLDELLRERWTVESKINLLKDILGSETISFMDMLETQDKEEIITSFLALLDLKRNKEVKVIQKENFGQILIERREKNIS